MESRFNKLHKFGLLCFILLAFEVSYVCSIEVARVTLFVVCIVLMLLYTHLADMMSTLRLEKLYTSLTVPTSIRKLYFIVGETASGKDTVCKNVSESLGVGIVCSFTTRGMRDGETNGKEHYFVSDAEFDIMEKEESIIAYTLIGSYRYGATVERLGNSRLYIINPDGVRWFRENNRSDLEVVTIYITESLDVRRKRASVRSDFTEEFDKRVLAEQDDFDKFNNDRDYDYVIKNKDALKTAEIIKEIIYEEEKRG